jgi:hypothetical protein
MSAPTNGPFNQSVLPTPAPLASRPPGFRDQKLSGVGAASGSASLLQHTWKLKLKVRVPTASLASPRIRLVGPQY